MTRVSVGVQSFDDRELSAVGRRHDAACAARALETLASEGKSPIYVVHFTQLEAAQSAQPDMETAGTASSLISNPPPKA